MKLQINKRKTRERKTAQSLNVTNTSQVLKDSQTGLNKIMQCFNKDPLATMHYAKMYSVEGDFDFNK